MWEIKLTHNTRKIRGTTPFTDLEYDFACTCKGDHLRFIMSPAAK